MSPVKWGIIVLLFTCATQNALEKSIILLEGISLSTDLEKQARDELLISFHQSLAKVDESPIEEREDGYTHFVNDDGSFIKGVKLHNATNTLHLYGSVVHKRVLLPGNYKQVNSKPLTIAKNKLKYICPVGQFRQFKITS